MLRRFGVLVLTVVVVGGCSTTITVPAAPHADDPACAAVILAMPESLGDDLPQVMTDAQGTTAWGKGGAAVTARCGVEVPGPTSETCVGVGTGDLAVDWVVRDDGEGTWVLTTYGRTPAVEVTIPPTVSERHSSSFVTELAPAITQIPALSECVGVGSS